ncbi:ribosomal RNA-processing protein 7 homolog A-like [Liolophura sinensis]|uniref:ribosomal RNA-processing protein 7 homolog A-like n=1 Tax=Liolophura sinensis TaxID=3198878 RepID=UPI003158175A
MANSEAHGVVIIQGFTVIQVKFSERSKACHQLYLKEHSVRESSSCKPKDRTLFVVGVPPYCDEECFKRLFSDCGKVQHVYFHTSPTSDPPVINRSKYFPESALVKGFRVAYVVFRSPGSIAKAKSIPFEKARTLSTVDHPLLTGIKKWKQQYLEVGAGVDTRELQAEIEDFMTKFDQNQEEELQKAKENEGVPDEDGWVTVTRHGKNKGAPRTEVHEKRINVKEKKKRKEKELLNFYSFQLRESKMEHIATLRQKFEEDKQKIALMKQARKFRPY